MAGSPTPPSKVLPPVRTVSAPSAIAGALAGTGGGGPGAGAPVSHVSESAAEILGGYAAVTGGSAPKPSPAPIPAAESVQTSTHSPANAELQEGTVVKLGDLEQFLKLQDGPVEGCSDQDFNPGKFLRERIPQVRLSSPSMAARAIGKLSHLRAPSHIPR